jgi:AcrR family transcriptional regulator
MFPLIRWLSTDEPSPSVLDVPHRTPHRKAQLADAAAELFGRRGYHAVSVNDIAYAAGVTGPAMYRHFGSKQDVLAHVLISGLEVFGQVTEDALGGVAGVGEAGGVDGSGGVGGV